jgi:hypothetical protein
MWFHKNDKFPDKAGFVQALGIVSYVTLFTGIITSVGKFMPGPDPWWAPLVVLTLLCFSVLTCGLIVFYKPYMLFIDKQAKEAGQLVLSTAKWLGILTIIIVGLVVIVFK